MGPYVKAKDLYRFKLALILGRGKRLKRVLQHYPTEKKFKRASLQELAEVIGITDLESSILNKLRKLDTTYDEMVTFLSEPRWSKSPRASKIMGIDTEYLNSNLDCIQYVIMEELELLTSGFIFTNDDLAPSVSKKEGIDFLRGIIAKHKPELIVGHNFNSDITVLETAYGDSLPELYYYDDTVDLMKWSHLSNIIGGCSLNKAIKKVFNGDVIGLFSAYNNLELLIEYGIKDAVYPVFLRYYVINGEFPEFNFNLKVETILKKANQSLIKEDGFQLSFK